MVELLHGTSKANWQLIQEAGVLGRPCPARQNAFAVASKLGLDGQVLYEHTAYEFSRNREGDPLVYLTSDPRVAERHAEICSEILEDALMAAFRLLHPRTHPYKSPGSEKLERFRAGYRRRQGLEPLVLRVRMPLRELPLPEHSKVQDPGEWWRLVNSHGPLNCLAVEPLSSSCARPL